MTIDIDTALEIVEKAIKNKPVPIVDLIAVQTEDPYKVLVATILSARTKDETTAVAADKLFKKAPDIDSLAALSVSQLEKLIFPVGFFRNKAGFLHKLPAALETFGKKVPETIDELVTLPGVGRKTANLVVAVAFKKPAICVDTHVHRIMNIWQYVATDTPLQTEMALRDKLPQKHWISVNSILVAFGQSICRPVSPHCDVCPLNASCPKQNVTPRKVMSAKTRQNSLTMISWNVNGIRAVEKKGFTDQLKEFDADIVAIQETKAQPDQLSDTLKQIDGYSSYFHSAEKKGYSGVALYCRQQPVNVTTGLGIEEFDSEGRVICAEYETFYFVNVYFPNSGDKLKRLDFKIDFNKALHRYLDELAVKKSVVLCGDYNVAHKEIDLKNPKTNTKNAGFTPEERSWMDEFIDSGYIDTFRMFNEEPGQYTWWSYRFNARAKDIGWRIDYFCVDGKSRENVVDASILKDVMGSDHCPVRLVYKP